MTQEKKSENTYCDSFYPDLYLASQSPQRVLLLEQLSVDFSVLADAINASQETLEPPNVYVLRMSKKGSTRFRCLDKSNAHAAHTTVLAADTAVVFNRRVLGKPRNASNAKKCY